MHGHGRGGRLGEEVEYCRLSHATAVYVCRCRDFFSVRYVCKTSGGEDGGDE